VQSQGLKELVPRAENGVCEPLLQVQHLNLMWCLSSEIGNCTSSNKAAARQDVLFPETGDLSFNKWTALDSHSV